LSSTGNGISRARARIASMSLNVHVRGAGTPSLRSSAACAVLLISRAKASAPFSTRTPRSCSARM
jgi:hypothetical protein